MRSLISMACPVSCTGKRQSCLSFQNFEAVPVGRAIFRYRLFWFAPIPIAAFESTCEILDRIWWLLRVVAVLHLASGATLKVDAASS